MYARSRLVLFCLALGCGFLNQVFAVEPDLFRLEVSDGQDIEIHRYRGTGNSLVVWLPSERGFDEAIFPQAAALSELGHEVWLVDLHGSYFVQPERSSISRFPINDVTAIVSAAVATTEHDVFLLSGGRGAQLGLIAAREWQLANPGARRVKGALLMHAYLYASRPQAGEAAAYLPIASATNLPVYLLDAQYSTKSARIRELARVLGSGGSQVYTQVLKGVQGGYHIRDDDQSDPVDLQAKRDFASTVSRAFSTLALVQTPHSAQPVSFETRKFSSLVMQTSGLVPMDAEMIAPVLSLEGYDQQRYALSDYRGRVVLVNFWASWCKPCVDEIPSLHRLKEKIGNPEFEIVTVNVGEDRDRISRFLERTPVSLPLLMDADSSVAREWEIYLYPSSYLVDQWGRIRHAYLGALEWDSTEIRSIIDRLLNQSQATPIPG